MGSGIAGRIPKIWRSSVSPALVLTGAISQDFFSRWIRDFG